jgi:hypothetical protein
MVTFFVLLPLICFLTAIIQCIYEAVTAKKPTRQLPVPVVHKFTTLEESPPPPPVPAPKRDVTAPVRRSTVQIGAVTCEVVQFEDFDLIRTNENAAQW